MKKLLFSSFVSLVLFSTNVLCQKNYVPGYIITNEFDTIPGLIDSRMDINNALSCIYKSDLSTEPKEYFPGDIFGYRFLDGKYYISMKVPKKDEIVELFLEYIVDGVADLFYYNDIDGGHYFLTKDELRLVELTNVQKTVETKTGQQITRSSKRYQGVLTAVFSDAKQIQPEIEKSEFTHSSLAAITETYHSYVCLPGDDCIKYLKEIPPAVLKFGIYGGAASHTLYYSQGSWAKFGNSELISPNYGVLIELNSPRFSEKVSLQLQLEYHKTRFSTSYEESRVTLLDAYYMETTISSVSAVLSVKYQFVSRKIQPYFGIGAGPEFISDGGSLWTHTTYLSGVEQTHVEENSDFTSSVSTMIKAMVGVNYKSSSRITPFLEIKYQRGASQVDFFNAYGVKQFTSSLGATVGILF